MPDYQHPNALAYQQWLASGGFRISKFALSYWDMELMIQNVFNAYHKPYEIGELSVKLEDFFLTNYTENYNNTMYYTWGNQKLGEKAFSVLKQSEWAYYTNEYQFMTLFNRCVLFHFKNSAAIKKYFLN